MYNCTHLITLLFSNIETKEENKMGSGKENVYLNYEKSFEN